MKLCPLCGTSYPDESISYCLSDGSSLVASVDEQTTVVRPAAAPMRVDIPQPVPTPIYTQQPQYTNATSASGGWGTVVKVLLAIALVLFLLLAVMGAAGVLIYLNSGTRESASGGAVPTETPATFPTLTPVATVSPAVSISPTPSASVTPTSTPTPPAVVDKDAALRDVFDIENVIIRSTFKGDIAALESNTTDDFTSTDAQGRNFNKRQMIAEIRKGEARNYVYKLGKPTIVSADENTVVFRYQLQAGPPQSEYDRVTLTETYVKRDGRWLLRSQKAGGR